MNKTLKGAGHAPAAKRDRAIVSQLYGLGLSRTEVAGLDLADVDCAASKVRILGKGRREKIALEMPPQVYRDVADWVLARRGGPGPLFHRLDRGGALTCLDPGSINRIVGRLGKAAGLPGALRPHGFRNAAITGLFRRKKTVPEVMAFSRHSNPKTVMGYLDAMNDDAEIAREVSKDFV